MLQMFIDWYGKLETALKEVRVGFPEMLKQHILAVGHDVGVFFTAHGMVVALAVAAAFTIGLVAYLTVNLRNTKRELEKSEWAAVAHRTRASNWRKAWIAKGTRVMGLTSENLGLAGENAMLESRNDELEDRNTELSNMNSDLNEKVDEMQVDIESLTEERDDAVGEVSEQEERADANWDDLQETQSNLFRVEEERDSLENELEEMRNKFNTSTMMVDILK